MILPMYGKYEYKISVFVTLVHSSADRLRSYFIEYIPDALPHEGNEGDPVVKKISDWRSGDYGEHLAVGIISVAKIFEAANLRLGLKWPFSASE